MRLENKTALITGGAQGIGREIARTFTREGAFVYVADINEKLAADTVAELQDAGGKAASVKLDVTRESDWIGAVGEIVKERGRIDILVNNAGITKRQPLTDLPVEEWDQIMAINARGPFLGIKHVIPVMRRNGGGSIVNMSSICGLVGHKFSGESYIVSKGAVTLMTRAVAVKYAKDQIRCNSVHPSTADTAIMRDLFRDPAKRQERIDEIPLGRMAKTEEIANAVLFLASDEASFITGVALPVDGGLTAY
ncbi:SDR family oxidoreductase [Marispirochaeta aestuarii]|uniref:SDR family NAD(P)-dependent oxidoreductase n=1 Tax=Marispirochaeta aestuarii TaxID=1963862 RepID=UPI0029C97E04|nr:SDR family oxidoreductase [Marispirochaeta aestuarii]